MLIGIEKTNLNKNGTDTEGRLITIHQQDIIECALNILTELVLHKKVTLYARGDSIPTAVGVANVVTENMMKDNSKVLNVTVDSEDTTEQYGPTLISIIKITIAKTN